MIRYRLCAAWAVRETQIECELREIHSAREAEASKLQMDTGIAGSNRMFVRQHA